MRRPVGVIVAAVVLGLMALIGICGMLLSLVFAIFFHNPIIPSAFRPFIIFVDSLALCFFLFCAWTVVALFQMRPWSRISAIILGALVFLFSAIAGVAILLVSKYIPMPPGPTAISPSAIIVGIAGFYGFLALIGAWWLVYFNLRSVRAAFTGAGIMVTNPDILPPGGAAILPPVERTSGWRIVIIVWACFMLVGVLSLPMVFIMHIPMFIFGAVLTGTAETLFLLVLVAAEVYVGVGLLKKWKAAWYVALVFQIYTVGYVLALAIPANWARFVAYQQQVAAMWSPPGVSPYPIGMINMGPIMAVSFLLGIPIVVVCTMALFKRKADYLGA